MPEFAHEREAAQARAAGKSAADTYVLKLTGDPFGDDEIREDTLKVLGRQVVAAAQAAGITDPGMLDTVRFVALGAFIERLEEIRQGAQT